MSVFLCLLYVQFCTVIQAYILCAHIFAANGYNWGFHNSMASNFAMEKYVWIALVDHWWVFGRKCWKKWNGSFLHHHNFNCFLKEWCFEIPPCRHPTNREIWALRFGSGRRGQRNWKSLAVRRCSTVLALFSHWSGTRDWATGLAKEGAAAASSFQPFLLLHGRVSDIGMSAHVHSDPMENENDPYEN